MTPVEYVCPAPPRLIDWLKRDGFVAEVVVTRAKRATVDPDMIIPGGGVEFSDEDRRNIAGLFAGYDATEPYDGSAPEVAPEPAPESGA